MHEARILHIEAEVGLLIGNDAYKAMEHQQILNSRGNGPYAVRTSLGWVINGPLRGSTAAHQGLVSHSVNRISISNVENMLTQVYNANFPERRYDDETEMSKEDCQFLDSVKRSTQLVIDNHYSINLPLKDKCPKTDLQQSSVLQASKRSFIEILTSTRSTMGSW